MELLMGLWTDYATWVEGFLPTPIAYMALLLHKLIFLSVAILLSVAYLTLAERKIIGYMQARIGPNRVGFKGSLQPIADVLKLIFKEITIPKEANRLLFLLGPIFAFAPVLVAFAVIPFDPNLVLANVNAGLLFLLALTAVAVYGVLLAGWASNSKYPLLSTLRATSAVVSYEIAMGFALITVVMASGSLNLGQIVIAQQGGIVQWYIWPLLPMAVVFFISGMIETNRTPFCVIEGESEIVGGVHVEYSGMAYALLMLAEYAHLILLSLLTTVLFFGGWLSPFESFPIIDQWFQWMPPIFWLLAKTIVFLYVLLWTRATFPRYRYDQIMHLGWKVFIPLTMIWIALLAFAIKWHLPPWFV